MVKKTGNKTVVGGVDDAERKCQQALRKKFPSPENNTKTTKEEEEEEEVDNAVIVKAVKTKKKKKGVYKW